MDSLSLKYLILACLGMMLHVFIKIYERKNQEVPFSFRIFFNDSINWVRIGIVLSSVFALMLMSSDIMDILGITLVSGAPAKSIFSFLAGYLNHSLIVHILNRFKSKVKK